MAALRATEIDLDAIHADQLKYCKKVLSRIEVYIIFSEKIDVNGSTDFVDCFSY